MTETVDRAYAALRDRIFSGELRAGDRLKERDVCADLKISRTPVREALRRLQADGLVDIEPRRGGIVAGISASEIDEVYSLGILLESFAARLAAQRASAADLDRLRGIIGTMDETLAGETARTRHRYLELDSELHRLIVTMAANRRLSAAVQQIVSTPVLVQAFTHYSQTDLERSLEQHRNIVAALAARDPDWAESAMRAHIHAARAIMSPTPVVTPAKS